VRIAGSLDQTERCLTNQFRQHPKALPIRVAEGFVTPRNQIVEFAVNVHWLDTEFSKRSDRFFIHGKNRVNN
jgi:hypothetical protein